jgi:hypothetical protein
MENIESERAGARDEFVTIIAPTMTAVMAEFKARDLAALGYAIVGKAGWHRFQLSDGPKSCELFDGRQMLAATFHRPHTA